MPDRDPLSLISIFAKRSGVAPAPESKGVFKYEKATSSSKDRKGRHTSGKRARGSRGHVSTDSMIEEDYSNDFEESKSKTDSIEEDIPKKSSSSGSARFKKLGNKFGSPRVSSSRKGKGHHVKDDTESIADEVIDEESLVGSSKGDSIAEESLAKESASRREDSIKEDSIIKEDYSDDNFESYQASQKLEARNRLRFGMSSKDHDLSRQDMSRQERDGKPVDKSASLLR